LRADLGLSVLAKTAPLLVPLVGGIVVSGMATVLMEWMPLVWVALLLAGLIGLVPLAVVKDPLLYLLSLFLLALPLNVSKRLGGEEQAVATLQQTGALAGGLPTPMLQLTDLVLIAMVVLWLVRKLRERERLYLPPSGRLPLLLIGLTAVTAAMAPHPFVGFLEVYRQLKFYVIYLFTSNNVDLRRMGKRIVWVLLIGLLIQSGVTIARYRFQMVGSLLGGSFGRVGAEQSAESFGLEASYVDPEASAELVSEDGSSRRRGFGTLLHPNATAMYFELLLPMVLALFLGARHSKERLAFLALLAIGLAALYVTFSRGGMLGFLASVLVIVALATRRGIVPRPWLVATVSVALVAGVIAVPSYLSTRPEYFTERFDHIERGFRVVAAHPIFGVGLNNSSFVRGELAPMGETAIDKSLPIHSHWIIGLAETGVIGFGLYVAFFVLIGRQAHRLSASTDQLTRVVSLGVVGAYVALSIHLVADFANNDALHSLLWFYAGIITAARRSFREPLPEHAGVTTLGARRLGGTPGQPRLEAL
jgi:hypothetical protein